MKRNCNANAHLEQLSRQELRCQIHNEKVLTNWACSLSPLYIYMMYGFSQILDVPSQASIMQEKTRTGEIPVRYIRKPLNINFAQKKCTNKIFPVPSPNTSRSWLRLPRMTWCHQTWPTHTTSEKWKCWFTFVHLLFIVFFIVLSVCFNVASLFLWTRIH